MSFTYGFYDSINHDRTYNARQMSEIFDGIINDGVFESIGNKFMVSAVSGMQIKVGSGRAWLDHTWTNNDSDIPLTLDDAEPVYKRIDAIVLEVNEKQDTRANSIKVIKGTPATYPNKPTLVDADGVHQHPLAWVTVNAGTTAITQANIENAIGTSTTPYVTAILQTTNVDQLLAQWDSEFGEWFRDIRSQLEGDVVTNLINRIDNVSEMATESIEAIGEKVTNITPKIGDIMETVNDTIQDGQNWIYCNGEKLDREDAPALYDHLDSIVDNGWDDIKQTISPLLYSPVRLFYQEGYYIIETPLGAYATKRQDLKGWFKISPANSYQERVIYANGVWNIIQLSGATSSTSMFKWATCYDLEDGVRETHTHDSRTYYGLRNVEYIDGHWYFIHKGNIYRSSTNELSSEFVQCLSVSDTTFSSSEYYPALTQMKNGLLVSTFVTYDADDDSPTTCLYSCSSLTGEQGTWTKTQLYSSTSTYDRTISIFYKHCLFSNYLIFGVARKNLRSNAQSQYSGLYYTTDGINYNHSLAGIDVFGVVPFGDNLVAFGYDQANSSTGYWIGTSPSSMTFHNVRKMMFPIYRTDLPTERESCAVPCYILENFDGNVYVGGNHGVFMVGNSPDNLEYKQILPNPKNTTSSDSYHFCDLGDCVITSAYTDYHISGSSKDYGYEIFLTKKNSDVLIPIGSTFSNYYHPDGHLQMNTGNSRYLDHHFGSGPDGILFVDDSDDGDYSYVWRSYSKSTPLYKNKNRINHSVETDCCACGYVNGLYYILWGTGTYTRLTKYSIASSFVSEFTSPTPIIFPSGTSTPEYMSSTNPTKIVPFDNAIPIPGDGEYILFLDVSSGTMIKKDLPFTFGSYYVLENTLYIVSSDNLHVAKMTSVASDPVLVEMFPFIAVKKIKGRYYGMYVPVTNGSSHDIVLYVSDSITGPWGYVIGENNSLARSTNAENGNIREIGNVIGFSQKEKHPTLPLNNNETTNMFICAGTPENLFGGDN